MKNLLVLIITLVTMTLSASAQTETIVKTIYVNVTNFGETAPNNITDPATFDENFTVVGYNLDGVYGGNLSASFDENTGLYNFTIRYEHDITSNINNVVVANKLSQNYPNPFESESIFDVNAIESEFYNISVYDMSGMLVYKYDFYLTKGIHNFTFDGGVSGNYVISVNSKNYSEKIKMNCVGNNSYVNISHNGISENVVESDLLYNTKSTMENDIIICEETSVIEIYSYVGGYYKSLGYLNVSELVHGETLDNIEYHLFIDNRSDGYNSEDFNTGNYWNVYNTVEVDGEYWMSENMRYLPSVNYPDPFDFNETPKRYVYGFNSTDVDSARSQDVTNYAMYGVLYNHYAVVGVNVCPDGWYIPTVADYTDLILSSDIVVTEFVDQFGGRYNPTYGFHEIDITSSWLSIYNDDSFTFNVDVLYDDTNSEVSDLDAAYIRCVKD